MAELARKRMEKAAEESKDKDEEVTEETADDDHKVVSTQDDRGIGDDIRVCFRHLLVS